MKKIFLMLFFIFSSFSINAADLVSLNTRDTVQQKFILIAPDNPVASVILFAGGKGALDLGSSFGSPYMNWGSGNFLVRSRDLFAEQGFLVAVVDAPSDQQSSDGMYYGFRNSSAHVQDIDAVIAKLRELADVPVWLIGTSRGTESAAHIAIHSTQKPDGLVLTSSMSEPNDKGTAVPEMALDRITVPTLVVSHNDDGCYVTLPEAAKEIAGLLIHAKNIEVEMFNGGWEKSSNLCRAKTHHGFLGIEGEVVNSITEFIKSN